jgi:hypothetical protein
MRCLIWKLSSSFCDRTGTIVNAKPSTIATSMKLTRTAAKVSKRVETLPGNGIAQNLIYVDLFDSDFS